MAKGIESGCINHPAVLATARCKSCLKPVCNACKEVGPTGVFCSTVCREKHEQFVERAAKLEQMPKPKRFGFYRVRSIVMKIIVFAALAILAGFIADMLGVTVPVLSDVVARIKEMTGLT